MSYYGSLCTQMYELDKPNAPEEELKFYMNYAKSKNMKILEPMCGSGRFLVPFAEAGYSIDGFDISKDMLDICRKKCTEKGLEAELINTSIEKFSTNKKYDLIMMPGQSFSLIIDDKLVISSLSKLRKSLKYEGTLLVEVLTTAYRCDKNDQWQFSKKKTREDGKIIVESIKLNYNEEKKIISYPLKYELYHDDTMVETEIMDLYIRLYEIQEMMQTLKQVGFTDIKPLKAYSHEDIPKHNDDTVIFQCKL